jgi:uncharacterized protein YkwD
VGYSRKKLVLCLLLAAGALLASAQSDSSLQNRNQEIFQPEAERLLALANQARAAQDAGPLRWDPTLVAAAHRHCLRMAAAEGPIAHRYDGEPELLQRAALAGAHFDLIEENIAIGPNPDAIHGAWMHSEGHRENLLNPEVDRVGVAVLAQHGKLYAVADYARAVPQRTQAQVEAAIADLVRVNGVAILRDPSTARAACALNRGLPASLSGPRPQFVMRWQNSDLNLLPGALSQRLASSQFRQAAIGSCPAGDGKDYFTAFRVAVLLY